MAKPEYKPTASVTFTVKRVGEVRSSQRGDPFLECDTDIGMVAFWGGKVDQGNLDRVQAANPPFRVTCEAFKPESTKYALWVPQRPRIVELVELKPAPGPNVALPTIVSTATLAGWRHSVLRIVSALDDGKQSSGESVAARIGRLTRDRKIPREVAALMRTITEIRNTAEYEGKVLSATESAAVSGAWSAVQEWALKIGVSQFE